MLIATEHLGAVGVGITVPQFFRADDGNIYVVKFQDNRLNSRVAVSELFAAKIGQIMGLCFPPSDIIAVDEQMVSENPGLLEVGINVGLHFASRFLDHTEYVGKNGLYKAINVSELAGVLLFDHMFHNADRARNKKNLLLRLEGEEYKVYAIDNSHLFRSSRWAIDSFHQLGSRIKIYYVQHYRNLLKDLLYAQDFLPYLEKVKMISGEQIDCIVREIPYEWMPDEPERLALAEYTKMRRDMADEIWNRIWKQIPRSRGGRRSLFAK
ncbi:hypothetical protein SDC9_13764 [bioreactor metagenome]|uniref:HipA-like kinase domain-containing protein n=1 Tax=bioreactor metagenome TaxID=1076179 RepID=A0A644TQT5_9ZZZZ|nr:hypothetical protein [Negativicutes bacterium]